MRRLKVTQMAKREAIRALKRREELPKSKRFGLSREQARREGVASGVQRAKQIIRSDSISLADAKRVAAFYQRFKNKKGSRAEGAIDLWGGRTFGKKAVAFVRRNR